MNVRVLFFGATADEAGLREAEFRFEGPLRAREAFATVLDTYPALKKHKLLFARNQQYIKGEEVIAEGDELAVFTAVSGG